MKDRSDQVRMVKNEWISDRDVESPEKLGKMKEVVQKRV